MNNRLFTTLQINFLHLPRPKGSEENQFAPGIYPDEGRRVWANKLIFIKYELMRINKRVIK